MIAPALFHQNVDPPELANGFFHGTGAILGPGHVAGDRNAPAGPGNALSLRPRTVASVSLLRPVNVTRAPARSNSSAMNQPKPRLPPVTMTTRSFSDEWCNAFRALSDQVPRGATAAGPPDFMLSLLMRILSSP